MAWRSAGSSLTRSLASAARASSQRSAPSLPRLRPPPRLHSRRRSFASPRNLGELGCTQSLLPINCITSIGLTAHLAGNLRAFCELSHGTFRHTCQDRWEEWKRRLMQRTYHSKEYNDATLYLRITEDSALSCALYDLDEG